MLSMPLRVRSVELEFAEVVRWHMAPFRRRTRQPEALSVSVLSGRDEEGYPSYSYYHDSELVKRSLFLEELMRYAVWDLPSYVAKSTRDFLLLHSGAVVEANGALLLPASMDKGKSSLVTALLQRGYSYLSDEVGAIDPVTSRVYPFEKHLSLDDASLDFFPGLAERLEDHRGRWQQVGDRFVRPQDLGASVGRPAEARWLVFPSDNREGPPRLRRISAAEAVHRMASNCFNLYRYGERGAILLARVSEGSQAFELEGGTIQERADLVADRFLT